ncbi:MAG: hypothetical protein IID40_00130 [Planctomycetes bacterium]|nr:hypothetical protein [Planctomycetota bacterium]
MTIPSVLAATAGGFGWIDWGIVLAYFAVTTVIGGALAGKQATIHDFFLGGRRLPWYAVSGSIIATEISALTFISVPFVVFRPGGNFTYLQLGVFGSFFARIIVGYVLVPAYYKREVYSPYDYMGQRLGPAVRATATVLFSFGGMLAQSARVYLTAVVLRVILHRELGVLADATGISELAWAVAAIGLVAIVWTLMGGIATVIWTDVILFLVFLIGAVTALIVIATHLGGGFAEMWQVGRSAGKFQFFDFDTDPAKAYTIWTAVIASTWGGLGAYGTDQLLAQRMFCCKNESQARLAIITSAAGQVVTFTVMLVGVGLFAYYQQHPLEGKTLALFQEKGDSIFPIFIMQVIPTGLKGLIIAGVFAAAVSSLDSIMAALSQTTLSAFYLPYRAWSLRRRGSTGPPIDEAIEAKRHVLVSRLFVVGWGAVLCVLAILAEAASKFYPSILDLGLAMAGYASGGLFAGFALAFLPLKIDGRGYLFSAPLSVLTVFAVVWHQDWAHGICWVAAGALILAWLIAEFGPWGSRGNGDPRRGPGYVSSAAKTLVLLAGVGIMVWLSYFGYWTVPGHDGQAIVKTISWPWYAPVGSTVAFVWGYLLAGRRDEPAPGASP